MYIFYKQNIWLEGRIKDRTEIEKTNRKGKDEKKKICKTAYEYVRL